jgi:Holliday junction resolvase RusA-like endonuclease
VGSKERFITILGIPIPKLRHRSKIYNRKVRTYDIQSEEKETIKWQLKCSMRGLEIITAPVHVDIMFYMPITKSTSMKQKAMMLDGTIKYMKKPDGDNLEKFFWDGMNSIVYADDKQIYKWSGEKRYSNKPRTEITLKWEDDE